MSYRYRSIARKMFRFRWNLVGMIEDHHVIPHTFKHHAVIRRVGFDIHSSKNLVMMPIPSGMRHMCLRPNRLVHYGGHEAYNSHVLSVMNEIARIPCDQRLQSTFFEFHKYLVINCRDNRDRIPWK
jgi:hypothetical protein